jgi:hypothetical protein
MVDDVPAEVRALCRMVKVGPGLVQRYRVTGGTVHITLRDGEEFECARQDLPRAASVATPAAVPDKA